MKKIGLSLFVFIMLCLYGCADDTEKRSAASDDLSNAAETKIVKDKIGKVKLPSNPSRIADLSGSTEELLVIGIKPVVSSNTDIEDASRFSPVVRKELGTTTVNAGWYASDINIEAVASAKPDLIIAGARHENQYEQLQKIAPTVMVPYDFNAFQERFNFIANLFDKQEELEKWYAAYETKAQQWAIDIKEKTKDETFAIIEATAKEIRIYAATGVADMVFNDLQLSKAEGTPEPDPWGGRVTSVEALASFQPDHIILMADNGPTILDDNNVWDSMNAVKNKHIYRITSAKNYNYAFTAMGKMELIDELGELIVKN